VFEIVWVVVFWPWLEVVVLFACLKTIKEDSEISADWLPFLDALAELF
jgi:hypothetical protein